MKAHAGFQGRLDVKVTRVNPTLRRRVVDWFARLMRKVR